MSLEEKKNKLQSLDIDLQIMKKQQELVKFRNIMNLQNNVHDLGFYPLDTIIVNCREKIKVIVENDIIDAQRINEKMCYFGKCFVNQMNLVEIFNATEQNIIVIKIENKKNVDINKSYEGKLDIVSNSIVNGGIKTSYNEKNIYDNNGTRITIHRYLKQTNNNIRLSSKKAKLIIFLEKHKKIVSEYIKIKFQDLMI